MNIRVHDTRVIRPAAGVVVQFCEAGADRPADHLALLALARQLGPAALPARSIGHDCDHCGGHDHGRPIVLDGSGHELRTVTVSLSRASGVVALAAAVTGPIGIDIENPAAVDHAPLDAAFSPRERAALTACPTPALRLETTTLAWCAKEAVAKLRGTGFRTPPETLELDLPRLILRPPHDGVTLTPLAAPAPLRAVLATT